MGAHRMLYEGLCMRFTAALNNSVHRVHDSLDAPAAERHEAHISSEPCCSSVFCFPTVSFSFHSSSSSFSSPLFLVLSLFLFGRRVFSCSLSLILPFRFLLPFSFRLSSSENETALNQACPDCVPPATDVLSRASDGLSTRRCRHHLKTLLILFSPKKFYP